MGLCENCGCLNLDREAVLGRVPTLTLRHTTDLPLAPVAAREMSESGHYTRGRSLRINDKAVSVESPPQVSALPPTLSICSRRARLLTSAAARLRSTDLLSAFRTASAAFAACGLVTHLAGAIMLHEAGFAVIVEQVNNVERYERQSRLRPPLSLIRLCPRPRGEMNE